ncbi:unnamed protein product [Effrenium voratum]|nr:unnamed protein product [Effrenium voratum]
MGWARHRVVRGLLALLLGPAFVRLGRMARFSGEKERGLTYQDEEYWEQRYKTGDKGARQDKIDDRGQGWLCPYEGPLQETLHAVTANDRSKLILNIGCGLDRLSPDIYADGYTNLLSTDISPHAVEEMQRVTKEEMPSARWMVDDIMQMGLDSESVDVIVDKGTLDALLIQQGPFSCAAKALYEIQRVLKVGGIYLLVTHGRGDPETWRLPLLSMPHLSFNLAKTPDMGGYYIFVCTKLPQEEAKAQAGWEEAQRWARQRDEEDQEVEFAAIDEVGQ